MSETEKKKKSTEQRAPIPVMSTSERLVLTDASPDDIARAARSTSPIVDKLHVKWVNNRVMRAPDKITVEPSPLVFTSEFALFTGVYLVTANTAAGKTVLTASLAAWANGLGIPSTYAAVFEPRAPLFEGLTTSSTAATAEKIANLAERAGITLPFDKPEKFLNDVESMVEFCPKSKPGLVVLDSVTDPLKAHATAKVGQPTFAGGMQPSDRDFLVSLARICKVKNVCMVCTVNTELIPYVESLYGATEGRLVIQNVRTFIRNDRSRQSARRDNRITIPLEFVNATLAELGFESYSDTLAGAVGFGFGGF